jgi:MFS superfamily sulfate permease-like transporter
MNQRIPAKLPIKPSAFFPFLEWLPGYDTRHLKGDLFAGLTVALVLIPQSMAYAQLAGLPSYYGLYAAFLPPAIAALFGSSRQLATGPVAVVSLMTAVALEPLAVSGSQAYIAYAVLLALMVGSFQLVIGLLRLGLVVNFLSHPVINGFTNAAAIIIATGQLPKLFGVSVDNADHHYQTIHQIMSEALHYTHWPTLLMGVLAFLIMASLKKISLKIPNVLVAVALTTLLSWIVGFEQTTVVPIETLEDAQTRTLVLQYNATIAEIDQMADDRSKLNAVLGQARRDGATLQVIDIQRNLDIIEYKSAQKNDLAATYRRELNQILMDGGQEATGQNRFFRKGTCPADLTPFGGTWRIQVGTSSLDPTALPLSCGGKVVGAIPRGLPSFSIPDMDGHTTLTLLPSAVIIALLGFMEAISIAKAMAAKTGQRIDPNQELIGQGLANILGAIGKSYPVAGSFSRSAVNLQAGAVSGLSCLCASLTVVVTLFFLTPLLYHLPQSVLAAIIMMAVAGLINLKGFIHAWRAQWFDGAISIVTFICTLVFAPHLDRGILVGVGLSLGVYLFRSMRPKVVDLSLGLDMALHDAVSHGLKECRYIDAVRFDGPLFFANASYLEDQIRHRRQIKTQLKHIIIAAEGINDMDASGQETLALVVDRVRSAGIDISMSGVNESVMQVLKRTHLFSRIGADHFYPSIKNAIRAIHEQTHKGGSERRCPLTTVRTLDANASGKGNS